MFGHIFTLQLSHVMAVSTFSTAVEGLHCAARPPQNNTTVCISWLCNRFPKREMAQGQSHTIKINVSMVYQEALGSQHSTAVSYYVRVLLFPPTCGWGFRTSEIWRWVVDSRLFGVSLCLDLQGCSGSQIYETARYALIARAGSVTLPRVKQNVCNRTAAFTNTAAQPVLRSQ